MIKKIHLRVKHFYRFRHRDFGEVSGQLTFYDKESGYVEMLLSDGSYQPMNLEFVEVIHEG